ncbi:hypothetical protein AOQ84DRAFT_368941 [Glonium stellatum]|uniref:Uncharacterized protein n=1 Tax=Glonium stellatum TaxID=574774 RepID=A0A8E2EQ00_9PEZI|nr:hypothetical protein AOQ84DRAFT_368941 [Glonium stellatum]
MIPYASSTAPSLRPSTSDTPVSLIISVFAVREHNDVMHYYHYCHSAYRAWILRPVRLAEAEKGGGYDAGSNARKLEAHNETYDETHDDAYAETHNEAHNKAHDATYKAYDEAYNGLTTGLTTRFTVAHLYAPTASEHWVDYRGVITYS